ncbi:MAG: hypothetical protein OJF50_003445 [Nitrospira sp.]|nr:hypothetical protein [Nitrospira sp.]
MSANYLGHVVFSMRETWNHSVASSVTAQATTSVIRKRTNWIMLSRYLSRTDQTLNCLGAVALRC